jgi:hypothetical protein
VTHEALAEYRSLADGRDYYLGRAADAFADAFDERFSDCLTGGEPYAVLSGPEGVIWEMTRPEVCAVEGERLRLRVSATVRLPLRFGGLRVGTVTVPLTVFSKYYSKFS